MSKLSDFDLDLSVGQAGEKLVEGLLTGNKTIEVKTDLKWKNTNNIYIETECWSHNNQSWYASGLSATKAEYWAFVLEGVVLIVPTSVLRRAVELYGEEITCDIEPNPSKGYLVQPGYVLWVTKELAK
jgi:hypothetical protein